MHPDVILALKQASSYYHDIELRGLDLKRQLQETAGTKIIDRVLRGLGHVSGVAPLILGNMEVKRQPDYDGVTLSTCLRPQMVKDYALQGRREFLYLSEFRAIHTERVPSRDLFQAVSEYVSRVGRVGDMLNVPRQAIEVLESIMAPARISYEQDAMNITFTGCDRGIDLAVQVRFDILPLVLDEAALDYMRTPTSQQITRR